MGLIPIVIVCRAAGWRWVRVVLRSEVVSAVLGTAFAVMAVSVCWLLSARTRTQRDHSTALAAAHVRPARCWPAPACAVSRSRSTRGPRLYTHLVPVCLHGYIKRCVCMACLPNIHICARLPHFMSALSAHCPGQSDAQVALAVAQQQTASEAGGTASTSSLSPRSSMKLPRTSSEMLSPPGSAACSLEGSGPNRCPLSRFPPGCKLP